jgi:hypothetical protein
VALVSKRFTALSRSPSLLSGLTVSIRGTEGHRSLRRSEALVEWVARHGRHLRALTLHIQRTGRVAGLGAAAISCLQAVAGAAVERLQELHVHALLPTLAWLPALTGLRRLALDLGYVIELRLPAGICLLTKLEHLALSSGRMVYACTPATRSHLP